MDGTKFIIRKIYFHPLGWMLLFILSLNSASKPDMGEFAEFKLRPLESNILNTNRLKPSLWFRYVDDIFIIWDNNIQELNSFLVHINTIDDNIKFTLEIEKDNRLPFLDLELIKNNGKIDQKIYRKPERLNCSIPFYSTSPFNYKIASNEPLIYVQIIA